MAVSVRWTHLDGKPAVAMTLPGGQVYKILRMDAWHLRDELERVLRTTTPPPPDQKDQQ